MRLSGESREPRDKQERNENLGKRRGDRARRGLPGAEGYGSFKAVSLCPQRNQISVKAFVSEEQMTGI